MVCLQFRQDRLIPKGSDTAPQFNQLTLRQEPTGSSKSVAQISTCSTKSTFNHLGS
jgi:hypothetical protein